MELNVQATSGGKAGSLSVSDAVFAVEFNEPLIHQVVTAYMAAARSGTKAQKTRAEVRGGGAKPFKQKGSGRARAGTTRGPLWRHGGRAFAAKPRSYEQKVNRKAYRQAMRSILSELLRQDRLTTVEAIAMDAPKTKVLAAKLKEFGAAKALILTDAFDQNLWLAARNLPNVDVLAVNEVDPVSLVHFDKVIATRAAVEQLEARLK
jgi:large subunit ribosomal protein L4